MLCVTDQRSATLTLIPELDSDGAIVSLRPPPGVGALARPAGLALSDSRIVICDTGRDRLVVWEATTHTWHVVTPSSPSGELRKPLAVAPTPGGGAYVAEASRVLKVADLSSGDGGGAVDVDVAARGVRRVVGLALTLGGALAVARADGTVGFSHDEGATWSEVSLPGARITGMCAFGEGVVAADLAGRAVWSVAETGAPVMLLREGDGLALPSAVAAVPGAPQELVVADAGWNRLRRYALLGGGAVAAEYVNGRRADGSFRFDRLGGLASGTLAGGTP